MEAEAIPCCFFASVPRASTVAEDIPRPARSVHRPNTQRGRLEWPGRPHERRGAAHGARRGRELGDWTNTHSTQNSAAATMVRDDGGDIAAYGLNPWNGSILHMDEDHGWMNVKQLSSRHGESRTPKVGRGSRLNMRWRASWSRARRSVLSEGFNLCIHSIQSTQTSGGWLPSW